MTALVEVRSLHVSLDGAPLVRDVSMRLTAGTCTALVGESGSGKTQTALALLGLSPSRAEVGGSFFYEGQPVSPTSLRGRVVYMPQEPLGALNPVQRLAAQVEETLRARTSSETVKGLLAQVGLAEVVGSKYPHELSGGMRQRALLALCLAASPAVLIVDEPTTALDASTRGQIVELLRTLVAARQMSVLLITHDLQVAESCAQTIAVMYAGALVEAGPAAQLLRAPRHPYTKALLASRLTTDASALPEGIPGRVPGPTEAVPGCRFHPRCRVAVSRCRVEVPGFIDGVACHEVSRP